MPFRRQLLKMKFILAIAGSDSCGGAGVQSDVKTITSLGAHALTAITAVTAQNSLGITAIHRIPARFLSRQIESIMADVAPDATKIGMLGTEANIREVARLIRRHNLSPVVLDPVLRSSTGSNLLQSDAVTVLKSKLLPLVSVVTPNLEEAEVLTGLRVRNPGEMEEASRFIKAMGPDVVITGGHLKGDVVDLVYDGKEVHHIRGSRIGTAHTHGTGCVFSSAMATFLAMGDDVPQAARRAHEFTIGAIKEGYPCGQGAGPVNPAHGNVKRLTED